MLCFLINAMSQHYPLKFFNSFQTKKGRGKLGGGGGWGAVGACGKLSSLRGVKCEVKGLYTEVN